MLQRVVSFTLQAFFMRKELQVTGPSANAEQQGVKDLDCPFTIQSQLPCRPVDLDGGIITDPPDEVQPSLQASRLGIPIERSGLTPRCEEWLSFPGKSPERLTAIEIGRAPLGNLLGDKRTPPGSRLRVNPCARQAEGSRGKFPCIRAEGSDEILRGKVGIGLTDRPP